MLPAPDGYGLATGTGPITGPINGPITPNDFDQLVGQGAAANNHFLRGYDVAYTTQSTDETIESIVLTFGSPADASGIESAIVANVPTSSLSPRTSTLPSLPGSVVLTGTKADPGGYYDIDVIAVKGPDIMGIEYGDVSPITGFPDVISTAVAQQYALL
jgi:hypothetical protein